MLGEQSMIARPTIAFAESEFVAHSIIQKSWRHRTFSSMNPGSLRASIFTLVSTAIGLGMLTLPYAIQQLGIIPGVSLLLANGFLGGWTMSTIVAACQKVNAMSYSQLVGRAMGFKWGVGTDILQLCYGLGVVIGYMNALGGIAKDIFRGLGDFSPEAESLIALLAMIISGVISIPLMSIQRVSSLATAGFISIFPFFALVVFVFVVAPKRMSDNFSGENAVAVNWASLSDTAPKANCMFLFAYMMHLNVVPVMMELENATSRRVHKTISRTTWSLIALYFPVGLLGYLAYPNSDKDTILANFDVKSTFAIILRFALFYSILISIPLNGIAVVKCGGNVFKAWKYPHVVRLAFAADTDIGEIRKEEARARESMLLTGVSNGRPSTLIPEIDDYPDHPQAEHTARVEHAGCEEVPLPCIVRSPLVEESSDERGQRTSLSAPNLLPFVETRKFRLILSTAIVVVSFLVAYASSSVTDILGIVSGLFSALMMLTLPMFVYAKLLSQPDSARSAFFKISLLSCYSCIAFFSVIWQIYMLAFSNNNKNVTNQPSNPAPNSTLKLISELF
eukprot:GDKJ01057548.1.p1 GENE.GDKJ01057548.1~~GDKJ01057548.1.p1  ORF type:complete len:564 (+),score=99.25 GDKJ01057548.1:24-1715(+)